VRTLDLFPVLSKEDKVRVAVKALFLVEQDKAEGLLNLELQSVALVVAQSVPYNGKESGRSPWQFFILKNVFGESGMRVDQWNFLLMRHVNVT
jgi:hypothetical protein